MCFVIPFLFSSLFLWGSIFAVFLVTFAITWATSALVVLASASFFISVLAAIASSPSVDLTVAHLIGLGLCG